MKKPRNDLAEIIFKTPIPPAIHEEYIAWCKKVSDVEHNAKIPKEEREKLLKKITPIAEKKKLLFRLSFGNTLSFLYTIQKYVRQPDKELVPWAVMCWQICNTNVLNAGMSKLFGDEGVDDLIMGGLGGDGKRLRYCFALSTQDQKFSLDMETIVREVIHETDLQHATTTEEINFETDYFRANILVPMDVAVGDVIDDIISSVNLKNKILRKHYFVVNTHFLSDDEIHTYIEEIKAEEKRNNCHGVS